MATYYWDFKFDYDTGDLSDGLVRQNVDGVTSEDITGDCTRSDHGLTYDKFQRGDLVNFNIFDGTTGGGCTLQQATITFTDGSSPFSSDVGGNHVLSLTFPEVHSGGHSSVFKGVLYNHWMFSMHGIDAKKGKFPFAISLLVSKNGMQKWIKKDPEMIVGGAT